MIYIYYDLNALAHTLTAFASRVSGNYTTTCGYGIIILSRDLDKSK